MTDLSNPETGELSLDMLSLAGCSPPASDSIPSSPRTLNRQAAR